jgi:tetratricopeptide (TPR) repeat protein
MIDRILELSTEEFAAQMRGLLSQDDVIWQFDDLDDALIKVVEERPEEVDRICTLNASLIAEMPDGEAKRYCRAYNYNTAMAAAFFRHEPSRVESIFSEGLAYCKEHALYEAGKSLVGNMLRMRKSASLPADETLPLLRIIKDFYVALGRHEDAIETLCDAALQFADVQAFQSAYRATNDAQEIAMGNKLPRAQVRVLKTQGMVALMEGDLKCAGDEFKKCLEILDHLDEPASFELRSNAALVELRSDRYEPAAKALQSLLDDFPGDEYSAHRRQLIVNLLICRRETRDEAASMALVEQIDATLDEADTEQLVETQLVVAKTLVRFEKVTLAMARLHDACFQIQREIDSFQRLHYRRGVRERYLGRVRAFLGDLPESGRWMISCPCWLSVHRTVCWIGSRYCSGAMRSIKMRWFPRR